MVDDLRGRPAAVWVTVFLRCPKSVYAGTLYDVGNLLIYSSVWPKTHDHE